jgi:uroporphyrinogen-III synthase
LAKLPLAGVRVVVTRAAAQAAGTCDALEAAGADIALLPLLEIVSAADPEPLAKAAGGLSRYEWIVFTSANGVQALFDRLSADSRFPGKIAAVGGATAEALRRRGWEVALIPDGEAGVNARGLLAALAPLARPGTPLLLPQAQDARPELAHGLTAAGFEVTSVVAYEKRLPPNTAALTQELFANRPLGWVTFASGSAARRFAALFGTDWTRRRTELRAASLGPATSATLRGLGVEPAVEARTPTDGALVAAISIMVEFTP